MRMHIGLEDSEPAGMVSVRYTFIEVFYAIQIRIFLYSEFPSGSHVVKITNKLILFSVLRELYTLGLNFRYCFTPQLDLSIKVRFFLTRIVRLIVLCSRSKLYCFKCLNSEKQDRSRKSEILLRS
jgi:hypothetical protein